MKIKFINFSLFAKLLVRTKEIQQEKSQANDIFNIDQSMTSGLQSVFCIKSLTGGPDRDTSHERGLISVREALVGCDSQPALTFLATTGAKGTVGAVSQGLSSIVVVCSTDGGSLLKPGHPVPAIVANHRFNGTINLYSCRVPNHPRKSFAFSSADSASVCHTGKRGAKNG